MIVDTHCHLDLPAFDADRAEAVARARAAGVAAIVVPAIRPRTWDALVALAAATPGLAIALGVHPQVVPALDDDERALARDPDALAARIAAIAARAPVVAVGECGLDGATGARALQEEILRAHLQASRTLGLPALLHVFRGHDAAPAILRAERAAGVLHSYSGGAGLVGVYAGLGLAFGFAGPVSYPEARRPVEAARAVPAELLLAETDAPDQAPAPHRGGRSEPAFAREVVAALAAARGASFAEVAALTTRNALRVLPRLAGLLQPPP